MTQGERWEPRSRVLGKPTQTAGRSCASAASGEWTAVKTGKLKANKAAAEGSVEFAYIEYARLSLDGVHCSVTALGRHLSLGDKQK